MKQRKKADDSHIGRTKEELKLIQEDKHKIPTNGWNLYFRVVIKHRRTIKEEVIAINFDRVYSQTCRLGDSMYSNCLFKWLQYVFKMQLEYIESPILWSDFYSYDEDL